MKDEKRANRNPQPFQLTSIKDARSIPHPRVEYLVNQLLPMDGVSILAGKPKDGKSTLARQLIAAVARD